VLWGLLVFAIGFALMYWALTTVSANMASVALATIPLVTLVITALAGQERITRRGVLGALTVIAGIGLIFAEQLQFDIAPVYIAALFLGVVSLAGSGVVVKYFPKSNPVATNAAGMSVSVVALLVLSLLAGESWALPGLPATWLALCWLVLSSILGFVLLVWLLARWSASAASYGAVSSPLVTVAVGLLLTAERPTPTFLIGSLIVLVGVYVGALSAQTASSKTPGDVVAPEAHAD
jgi:drug/metabolite transporter (DMT)-like permease